MLLRHWLEITAGWQAAFRQQRSFHRALAQALGTLSAFGRRTLSRAIWAQGHQIHFTSRDGEGVCRADGTAWHAEVGRATQPNSGCRRAR